MGVIFYGHKGGVIVDVVVKSSHDVKCRRLKSICTNSRNTSGVANLFFDHWFAIISQAFAEY